MKINVLNVCNINSFLVLLLFFSFCSELDEIGKTVVLAEDMDIPAKEVYLTTMEEKAVVLDTALVSNGSFRFSFTDEFDPFKACIAYRNEDGGMSMVYFKNDDSDSASSSTYSEFFVVERGKTYLQGKGSLNNQHVFASVIDGEENKLIFNPGYEALGKIDNSSKQGYEEGITVVKKQAEDYPYSFLLMDRVYANRGTYKKQDLEYILSKTEGKVSESANAYNLGVYLKNLSDDYDPLKAFPILNKDGVYVTDYDRKKKLNMLILTATWSHASNLLLYYMNLEKQNFESEDLYIVDIDANEVKDWWWNVKGSKENNFVWDELNVPIPQRQLFLRLYACDGFPLVIFTDQNGKEVKRFYDEEYSNHKYKYNSKNLEEIKRFIENYLDN